MPGDHVFFLALQKTEAPAFSRYDQGRYATLRDLYPQVGDIPQTPSVSQADHFLAPQLGKLITHAFSSPKCFFPVYERREKSMQNSLSRPLEKIFWEAFGHILSGGKIGFLRPAVEETYVNRKRPKTTRFSPVENPVDNVENSLLSTEKPALEGSFPQGKFGIISGDFLCYFMVGYKLCSRFNRVHYRGNLSKKLTNPLNEGISGTHW